MSPRLYGSLGRRIVGKINLFQPSLLIAFRNRAITPRNRLSVLEDFHHHDKRWFSKSFLDCSRTTRFFISSLSPTTSKGRLSTQGGDAANLDILAKCNEICLVQTDFNIEEFGSNTRKEYKYEITDKQGEKLFDAIHMYETYPPRFDFKLYGPNGMLLVTHKLLQNLSSHLLSMQIIRPGGMYLGSIEERLNLGSDRPPIFELRDSRDEVQAVVLTDFASTKFGLRRTIKILAPDQGTSIGKISKKWGGFHDKLVVSITLPAPTIMNVQFRASLIGLCLLLLIKACHGSSNCAKECRRAQNPHH